MTDHVEAEYREFMKALGSRIKQFRMERGLSLRDMVVKYDYHDSQWRRFERSGASSLNALLRIAKAFNTTLSILLDGLGEYPGAAVEQLQKNQTSQRSKARMSDVMEGTATVPTSKSSKSRKIP